MKRYDDVTLVPYDQPESFDWDTGPSYHNDHFYMPMAYLKQLLGKPNEEPNPKSGGIPRMEVCTR